MNLQGKTILITGGASGIGLEAATQLTALGNNVIVTGRNIRKLEAVREALPGVTAFQSDAADPAQAQELFDKVSALGGIDILYNNAGVGVPPLSLGIGSAKHTAGAAYEMDVNYLAVVRLNDLFMDMLNARPEAAIINTTSILSMVPSVAEATYSASKAALAFYTKMLREHLRLAGSKIKVFELLPPLVDTELVAARQEKKMQPAGLVAALIAGLKRDDYTIRPGDSKVIHYLNRFTPRLAFGLINTKSTKQFLATQSGINA